MKGRIFDVKRFAIHDGPGIRTTVFLKGCPLRCRWCHNPEGISFGPDIWVKEERCVRCGSCVAACKNGALTLTGEGVAVDRGRCKLAEDCFTACPTKAIRPVHREVEVEELAKELMRDSLFYQRSGGGVTLSGGEPLAQPEFALALLRRLREMGADTAVETSLAAPLSVVKQLPPLIDHFLCDLKLLDTAAHKKYTGVSNGEILQNFRYLARHCGDILVRVPLIPGVTDGEENLTAIAQFVQETAPHAGIELLNFNDFAGSKYRLMGQEYFDPAARALPAEELRRLELVVERSRKGIA